MVSTIPISTPPGTPFADVSDTRLRALTEHALEIITVQDAQGVFTYANEAVNRYLGYRPEELVGKNAIDFMHPDDQESLNDRFKGLLEVGADAPPDLNRFEYRIRHKNGGWLWLESVAVNALANPSVGGIIAHSRDIDRRKDNERTLMLNHARYRTVADLSEGAVYEYLMNPDAVYELVWTFGTERVYGCTEEDFRGRGWQSFMVEPDWRAHSLARTARYLRGETVEFITQIRRADGALRWIEVKNRPIADPVTGKFSRLVGVAIDVTERKVKEEVLRSQALAVEVMQEGVVLSDSGGIIRMTNPAFDRMVGAVSGSLIGKHLDGLACDPPLNRRIAESVDDAAARSGAPLVCELTVRGGNEVERPLFVEAVITSLVLRDERFWLTMIEDATARRQLEREVLEVSNREQQRIGNDLHDGLGQELTGIALLLRGLENRAEREAPALSPSIEEVALLVNDAIFTTRALARGLSPVTFDRGGIALALDGLAQRLSAMFHIDVRCEADDTLERGLESANALHLYRIAQEAVTNAAQHGQAGNVRIRLCPDGDRGLLRIEDDGGGFNPSTSQSKGLGLRIMRYRAQMMAGSLRIESARARGTTVSCWFPYQGLTPHS